MSMFHEMVQSDHWEAMRDWDGKDVTWYLNNEGSGKPIRIMWTEEADLPEWDDEGKEYVKKGVAEVLPADVPGLTDEDTIKIGSDKYAIASIGQTAPIYHLQLILYTEKYLGGKKMFGNLEEQ